MSRVQVNLDDALVRDTCCLINDDTLAPAMGMGETSTEEYTRKTRVRYARLPGGW